MKLKKLFVSIAYSLIFLALIAPEATVLANDQSAVSTVFAVVLKRLDTKNASLNQELTLRTMTDVLLDGVVAVSYTHLEPTRH